MTLYCIICGYSEEDVKKLFCFPRNSEKSKIWQKSLGMVYHEKLSAHIRLCDKHFEKKCFKPFTISPLVLHRDAIPTLFPAAHHQVAGDTPTPSISTEFSPPITVSSTSTSMYELMADTVEGTSKQTFISDTLEDHDAIRKTLIKPSLFKGVQRTNSTEEKRLTSIIKKKDRYLRKLKKKCRERGCRIKDLSTNIQKFIEVNHIFKGMSPPAAQFMISQIRCSGRPPHGRTWTLDDKVFALAIYKRSPKCYSLLRRLLAFPSKTTLASLLQKVPFGVGINTHIFKHLGECLKKYPDKDRVCSLVFDEMAIKEHIQYNSLKDCIEGVEDYGSYRTNKVANYALVFFVQGISSNWKQPVAYYFSNGGVTSFQLESLLKDVLRAMLDEEIPVIATVCDMGSANVKCLKNMGADTLNPYFTFMGRHIFTIFDVPHLLKCTRNLFKKHNVLVPALAIDGSDTNQLLEARWSDLVTAYEEDKKNPFIFRCLHKIKDSYLAPLRQNAMKVKVAAQTLSRSVSVFIYSLIRHGILPSRALATATFTHDVDQLFDSCNGSSKKGPDGKPFKCMVTKQSGHVSFWEEASKRVSQWRYIRKPQDVNAVVCWKPPSQTGWLQTLSAFQHLWRYLQSKGFTTFRPRALNQDGLENLFGAIRSGCGCNENPTVNQFIASLKTQVINGLTNQDLRGSNCEKDHLTLLSNLRSFLVADTAETEVEPVSHLHPTMHESNEFFNDRIAQNVEQHVVVGSIQSLSVACLRIYCQKNF